MENSINQHPQRAQQQAHEQPEPHIINASMHVALLAMFCYFLNFYDYACWASTDGSSDFTSQVELTGWVNVTQRWRDLNIIGITMSSVYIASAILFLIDKLRWGGILLSALASLLTFAWLVTATIYRFQHSGRVCSGEYAVGVGIPIDTPNTYLFKEGLFWFYLTILMWTVPLFVCCIFACCVETVRKSRKSRKMMRNDRK